MENANKPIIVPWDFSNVAEYALAQALQICHLFKRELILLHIVEKPAQIDASKQKLDAKVKEVSAGETIKISSLVKSGSIFDTIRDVTNEYHAEMAVMGTHGRKGMQKLTGSWALKVMANSRVPFLVVQEKPVRRDFKKIVFPLDFRSENKEAVKWMTYLAEKFESKFLIYKRKVSDKGFQRKITSNIRYAESYLKTKGVAYEIHRASGEKSFEKETVEFAKAYHADLLLVMVTRDINFVDYLLGAREQYMIANPEKIPVLCTNPRPAKLTSGFRAGGG